MTWQQVFQSQPAPIDAHMPSLRVAHALASLADALQEAEARIVNKLADASEDAWLFEEG
jgi:hypothetical protein